MKKKDAIHFNHMYLYVFVIFRQGGPVQLKAGVNEGLYKQSQTTTLGSTFPTLCMKFLGSLASPANQHREDETALTAYCPYLRRLECLTIFRP